MGGYTYGSKQNQVLEALTDLDITTHLSKSFSSSSFAMKRAVFVSFFFFPRYVAVKHIRSNTSVFGSAYFWDPDRFFHFDPYSLDQTIFCFQKALMRGGG